MKTTITMMLFLMLGGLCGCTTLYGREAQQQSVRDRQEVTLVAERVTRLEARLEGVMEAQELLAARIEELSAAVEKSQAGLESDLAELRQAIKASAAARNQLKTEMIQTLSRQMAEILKAQQSEPVRAEQGYWHTVEKGQTLSQIASRYGVRVSAIVKANESLKSEDTIIKIGQKLFIPE